MAAQSKKAKSKSRPAKTGSRPPGAKGPAKKPLVVDFHAHIVHPKVFEQTRQFSLFARIGESGRTSMGTARQSAETFARMVDPALRLRDMDRMGIDIQIISPSLIHQNTMSLDAPRALELVRMVNDGVAEAVARSPDRLAGLGIVPIHEPKLAAKELDRLVNKLGLRGVEIPTYINGREIGEKPFWPFWRKAEQLDVPVFIHPAGNADPRLRRYGLAISAGQPFEELLSMSSLIYDGVMDKFPKLKVLFAHGGGYLPFYTGRQDNAHRVANDEAKHLTGDISSYVRRFYYETVIFNPDMLEFLATKTPARHIVMGTDYPFGEKKPLEFVRRAKALSRDTQDAILGQNAVKLLKLRV